MNRRTKERVDLNLQCRLGPEKVLSVPSADPAQVIGLTENLSRTGMLMRWLDAVELPAVGSHLTVDIDLPADQSFGRRIMRCRTTVVRILKTDVGLAVGMKIRNIRFTAPERPSGASVMSPSQWELASMAPVSDRLN